MSWDYYVGELEEKRELEVFENGRRLKKKLQIFICQFKFNWGGTSYSHLHIFCNSSALGNHDALERGNWEDELEQSENLGILQWLLQKLESLYNSNFTSDPRE